MPNPSQPSDTPSDSATPPDRQVDPAENTPPPVVASELFADGLLTYLHRDTPARQVERVGLAMSAVKAESGAGDPRAPVVSSFRFPIRTARGWLAAAACLALASSAIFFGFPGETSAQGVVQQSIQAMRASGDRRYEIRLQVGSQDAMPSLPGAIIDSRSPNLLLLRANAPDGHEVIAGRDATGDWAIRRDGGVERQHPEVAWPRWARVGDESLFVDSVDRLLEELTKSYDLQREGEAKLEGKGDTSYRHIVGTKKRIRCPGGDHVEVWIDRSTNVVERLEMRWDQPAANAPPANPGSMNPEPMNPGPMNPGPMNPGADREPGAPDSQSRPPNADRRPDAQDRAHNGPPRDGPDANRRPRRRGADRGPEGRDPEDRGPEGRAPRDRAPASPDDRPDADDDRPSPPPFGPPRLEGPPDRPPPPREADRRGPDGPDGPDGRDGAAPPRPQHAGPEGRPERDADDRPGPPPRRARRPDGPRGPGPDAGPGDRRPPPKALIMQHVDAPSFDADWFTPETHIAK